MIRDAKPKVTLLVATAIAFTAGVAVTAWYFSVDPEPSRHEAAQLTGGAPIVDSSAETVEGGVEESLTESRRQTHRQGPVRPGRSRTEDHPTKEADPGATAPDPSSPRPTPIPPAPADEDADRVGQDGFDVQPIAFNGIVRGIASRGDADVPSEVPIDATTDPKCAQLMGDAPTTARYQGRDGKVANVFVYVTNPPKARSYAPPDEPVTLDQRGCQYHPAVFGVMRQQDIRILNSDPTLHNVHAFATRGEFNLAMPKQGQIMIKRFNHLEPPKGGVAQPVPIRCEVHPWMSAYAFVMDHPFFAVTDEEGRFAIAGLPDGTYQVAAWHAGFAGGPWQLGTAEISGGLATYDIDMERAEAFVPSERL